MDCEDSVVVLDDDDDNSDDLVEIAVKRSSQSKGKHSVIFVPDGDYGDEILFIEPEAYSPKKKIKLEEEKRAAEIESTEQINSDLVVTFNRQGIVFPHAREHCTSYHFERLPTDSPSLPHPNNVKCCEKCYCFVCEDLSSKCEKWITGFYPHCNAYAKNAYWEKAKKALKLIVEKKDLQYQPILSCIEKPCESVYSEVTKAEVSAKHFYNSIHSIKVNSFKPELGCPCACHTISINKSCQPCYWRHGYLYSNTSHNGASKTCHNAHDMASNELKQSKPSAAIVILDAVTMALASLDGPFLLDTLFDQLILLWLEACMHPKANKRLVEEAKKRIEITSNFSGLKLFLNHYKLLTRLLNALKPIDDPTIATYLHGNKTDGLTENLEIAKARLSYLKTNCLFSEAVNYILCVKVVDQFHPTPKNWSNCISSRLELVELLVSIDRYQEARTVSLWPLGKPFTTCNLKAPLPCRAVKKKNQQAYNICVFKSLKTPVIKALVNGLLSGVDVNSTGKKQPAIDKILDVACYILPTLHSKKTSLDLFDFYFDKLFSSDVFKCFTFPVHVIKAMQTHLGTLVPKQIMSGKVIEVTDLKIKKYAVHPEMVVLDAFAVVAANRFPVKDVLLSLHQKKLDWACARLLAYPTLQERIFPNEIQFFVCNILSTTGSKHISLEIMERWYSRTNGVHHFQALFQLAEKILEEGQRLQVMFGHSQEGLETKRKALKLSRKLSESVLANSVNQGHSYVKQLLKKIDDKFESEPALYGIQCADPHLDLEIKFFCEPSFQALENVRQTCSDEKTWLRKREVMLQFLSHNANKFPDVAIEIYSRMEMYDKLKNILSWQQNGDKYLCPKSLNMIQGLLKPDSGICNSEKKQAGFLDAISSYIGACLVFGCFGPWSIMREALPMNKTVVDILKTLYYLNLDAFKVSMNKAFHDIKELFLKNYVSRNKKTDLVHWLMEIREIYCTVQETSDWGEKFQALLRDFKQNNHLVVYLTNSVPSS